jgi:hypothetical protein
MLQRCTNPNATKYPQYGAKGITVCDQWRSFDQFLADMGERPLGMTLDRIDGAKGYSPDNCRWATPSEQMDNVCNVTWVQFQGARLTLSELSRRTGVSKQTLKYRIDKGWSDEALASAPSYSLRSR